MIALMIMAAGVPGPYNLVLRWGQGGPVIVRYENQERCDMAAVTAWAQASDLVLDNGKIEKADPAVTGQNKPFAFCIPA